MIRLASCALEGLTGHEAGRRLLEALYRRETGLPLPDICIAPRGKPFFEDSPLHFSITHTDRHAFCVLSDHPVGIDAEELDRRVRPGLAEKILSPSEKLQFDGAEDKPRALLTFWVLKEAAAKLTGEGLRGYPSHTAFSLEDPAVRVLEGCLVAILEENEENDHAV